MFWVGIALLATLGCVAASLTYLRLARHRNQSQGRRTPHPLPAVERSIAEDNVQQASAKTPQTDVAEHAGSEPCMDSGGEPLASGQQTSGILDPVKTIAPEAQSKQSAEPSTHEGQGDLTERPTGTRETEREPTPQVGERLQEPKTDGELLVEQPTDSDVKIDVGGSTASVDEVELSAKEQEPSRDTTKDGEPAGAQLETREGAVGGDNAHGVSADDTDKSTRGAEETAQGTSEEDVQAQPPTARAETHTDRLVSEPDTSGQTTEIPPRAEPQKDKSEDSPRGREPEAKEEQYDEASKRPVEIQPRKPAGSAAPSDVPPAQAQSTVGGEGKPDGTTEQTGAASRADVRQQKAPKAKKKRVRRRQPSQTRTEIESEEEKRLLAEVPKIPEGHKVTEDTERDRARRLLRPSRYRPPSQEPLAPPQPSSRRQPPRRARRKTFALAVRLLFERSGHFRVGLLPQREADLPEEIVLGAGESKLTVTEIHDAWYEDVYPENLAELLSVGIAWEGCAESAVLGYWKLSGRDLYVLATSDLRGPVQATRLKIGRKHVVLCRNSLLTEVEPVLHQAGCAGFTILDDSYGAPAGWAVIRDVVPTKVVRVENGPEILSILQPEPELEIDLQGGIYLHQSTWLSGFPPNICVSGDMGTEIEVFIDGDKAVAGDDGSFRNQGYDTAGEHRVSIPLANKSKTYRICENDESWTPWDAYSFGRSQLCGPLLLAMDASDTPHVVVVPSCNSVIIGAKPGDIAWCPRIRGPKQVGYVTFHPVWALPHDAFGCDKRTTRILLLDARRLAQAQRRQFTGKEASRVLAWSTAILNASRKGLSLDSSDAHAAVLWKEYKTHARSLWKKLKR